MLLLSPIFLIGTISMLIGVWLLKSGEYMMKKIGALCIIYLFLTSCVQIGYVEKINKNYSDSTKYCKVYVNIPNNKNKIKLIDKCKIKIKGVEIKEKCTVNVINNKIIKVYPKKEN